MNKKVLGLMTALILPAATWAESTVWLLCRSLAGAELAVNVEVNGKKAFDAKGDVKRFFEPIPPHMNYRSTVYTGSKCKMTFKRTGKTSIGMNIYFKSPTDGKESTYKSELPLTLEDGETYYVEVEAFGPLLNKDFRLTEISEKQALKILKAKDVVELPEWKEK